MTSPEGCSTSASETLTIVRALAVGACVFDWRLWGNKNLLRCSRCSRQRWPLNVLAGTAGPRYTRADAGVRAVGRLLVTSCCLYSNKSMHRVARRALTIACHWQASDKRREVQVIKIGTSSLVRPETQSVNLGSFARVCETVRRLRDQGATPLARAP